MIKQILGYLGRVLIIYRRIISLHKKNTACVYPLIIHDIPDCNRSSFEQLIDMLQKQHSFISPKNFELYMNGNYQPKENQLLLTFDDGYYSNYLVAKEILEKRNIKAIFFISTGFVGLKDDSKVKAYLNKNLFANQLPQDLDTNKMIPMSWDHVHELIRLGHTIGAHTKNHLPLSSISNDEQLNKEIVKAGEEIEKRFKISIEHFAFPFGNMKSINLKAMKVITKKYKYVHSGVRGKNKPNTNTWAIRREAIDILDNFHYNNFIANGGLSFYYYKDRKKLDRMVLEMKIDNQN